MRRRTAALGVLASGAAALALTLGFAQGSDPARGADHLDAPTSKKDGRVDINDVYVFHPGAPGSQDLSRTVLVMTVNPAAGVISGTEFHPQANYEFALDTNGDAREDAILRARFTRSLGGKQFVTVTLRKRGLWTPIAFGPTDRNLPGPFGTKAFAGLADDPFFFDLANFNRGATFCNAPGGLPPDDFFEGLNTSAIVVEVPTHLLGGGNVGLWGRTSVPGKGQIDRMGRPAILTVFIPPNPFEPSPELEDSFNFGNPANDQAAFRAEIVNSLTLLFSLNDASDDESDDAAKIQGLANVLLPDVLTVDLGAQTGFLNGRNLADDVIDAELGLITEGAVTTDCIPNSSTFRTGFPYVGTPNALAG